MGTVTPNISIYIPAAGETNYDASFAAGMINIDQHDHSGAPTKGVPIAGSGIAPGSITYDKLAANVADTTTGIGTNAGLPNQLQLLGIIKNLYQLGLLGTPGFIAMTGAVVSSLTLAQTANQILISNPTGVGGNPQFSLANPLYFPGPVSFDGGLNQLSAYKAGTFTPTIDGVVSGTTTYTASSQVGYYTQIGKMIMAYGQMIITAATGTGNAIIGGFPFNFNTKAAVGTMDFASGTWTWPAGATQLCLQGIMGTATAKIDGLGSAASGELQMQNTGATITFSIFYQVP